jgi:hypothetical protein
MELTKTKLNKILKKYKFELEKYNKEWEDLCKKKCKSEVVGDKIVMVTPSIYDHEKHNSKGAQLFKSLMKEFENYEVFPKKEKNLK